MKNLKTSDVLDLAADAVQMGDWTQYTGWTERDGGICLEGGILAARGGTTSREANNCPVGQAVREYLGLTPTYDPDSFWESGDPNAPLYNWNDADGRTKEEVIEVLRAAAAVERVKEAVAGYEIEDQPLPIEVSA